MQYIIGLFVSVLVIGFIIYVIIDKLRG